MKFSEYLASYITPQMTLLEKFNALINFIEENKLFDKSGIYKHTLFFINNTNNSTVKLVIYDNRDRLLTFSDIIDYQLMDISVAIKMNEHPVTTINYIGSGNVFGYFNGNTYSTISLNRTDYTLQSDTQKCELV